MRSKNLKNDNAAQQNGDAVHSVDRHGTKPPTWTTESTFLATDASQCAMEHGLFMKKNEEVKAPLGALGLGYGTAQPTSTESTNQFPSSLKTATVNTIKQKAARSPLRCNKNVSIEYICPSSSHQNDEISAQSFPENHRKRFFGAVEPQGEEMIATHAKKSCLYPVSSKCLTDASKKEIATNENDDRSLYKNSVDGQTEVCSSTHNCPDIQKSGPTNDAINQLSRVIDGTSNQLFTHFPTKSVKETKQNVAENGSLLSIATPGTMLCVPSNPGRKLRCVAFKNPLSISPPKGHCSQGDSITVPDFPLLVNFPDYVARAVGDITMDGTKHCVMCGTLCVCSASSARLTCKKGESSKHDESQIKNIIPRQNKGICTACDVAVWVVLDSKDQLEIKWCKGCKNFRPWNSFGEKRMATKCVRCRTRQKETYANQKKENSRKSTSSEWEVRTPVMT